MKCAETNLLVIKTLTFDLYNINKDIRIYILIKLWNFSKIPQLIQSEFHLSQTQIKKVASVPQA